MNFKNLQDWFLNEKICPLRSKIQSLLACCNQMTDSISESKLKEELLKSNTNQVIFSLDKTNPDFSDLIIMAGNGILEKIDSKANPALIEANKFFSKTYNVTIELVALSFNNTYKIVFTTDLFETYMPTLGTELAIAYPNATITINSIEKVLSITNTIDF